MKIEEKKVGVEIFSSNTNSNKYQIPDYQRPYVWSEERVEEFFNDLISEEAISLSFLGSFIFQKKEDGVYDIVDGQQRMITLAILIAVLRDISKEFLSSGKLSNLEKDRLSSFASSLSDRLTDKTSFGEIEGYTLKVWSSDEDFFNSFILEGSATPKRPLKKFLSQFNVYKNYNFLYKQVKKLITQSEGALAAFRKISDSIDKLRVVTIEVDSDEEAYTAFEIVNARGQELGNIDLLKNLFYKNASANDDLESMKSKWAEVISNIEDVSAVKVNTESFLKYFWHSYFGGTKFTTSKNLYRNFSNYIKQNGYNPVANDLVENSKIFRSFFDLIDYNWTEKRDYNAQILTFLKNIRSFEITQSYILFMSIIRNSVDSKKVRDIIGATEKFHFAYSAISKKQANKVEKLYGKFAEKFQNTNTEDAQAIGDIYARFIQKLEELFPGESEFMESFMEIDYRRPKHRNIIRYVFQKINLEDTQSATSFNFEENLANLEHIAAQSGDENIELESMHQIGNILPLSKYVNSAAGNASIKDKVEEYYKNNDSIPLVKEAVRKLEKNDYRWTEDDIIKRTKSLGNRIYKITKKLV